MDKYIPDITNPYGYIYCITNLINDKQYVGQRGKPQFDPYYWGGGILIKEAISQYGKSSFKREVLEWVHSRQELNEREVYWIDKLGTQINGYNLNKGGKVATPSSYWKVNMGEFLEVLRSLGGEQQLDVVIHILENTKPSSNTYTGTQRKISQRTGVSISTVSTIMTKLQKLKFIKQVQWGVYQVSPDILMRGSEKKREVLLSYYDESKESTNIVRHPIIKTGKGDNDYISVTFNY